MRRFFAWMAFVSVAGLTARGQAEPEIVSPRALGMGESLRAAASGGLATSQNPAGVALTRMYVIEGGYGYRPEDHSNIQAASICDSVTNKIAACLSYNHLSSDLTTDGQGDRSRHDAGITLAVPLGELSLGTTWRYVSYTETLAPTMAGTPQSHDGLLLDAGMTYKILPTVNIAAVGYNLVGADEGVYTRALGFGLAVNLAGALLLAADGRYDFGHSSGRYGGGLEYMVGGSDSQAGLPIRLGYVYDSARTSHYFTGGLGVITPRLAVDLAVRKTISGPADELMLQGGLRVFFPN